jgi:GNAT superfamily N-acetyltransferase
MHEVLLSVLARRIPEDLNGETGFLVTHHTSATYDERLALSSLGFVAEASGRIVGFLLAYPRKVFAPWVEAARIADPGYAYILDTGGPDVVLLDQIGVLPEWRRLGTAPRLYEAFAAAATSHPVMLDIVHAPVLNKRSVSFFCDRLGYRLMGEFPGRVLTTGIYRKDL